jgi:hypothetical protein
MNIYDLYEKGKFDEKGNQHILCEIIEFDDGQVVAKWRGSIRSLVIHKNINEFKQISLNDNRELYKLNQ